MKRFVTILLAAGVLISFSGCDNGRDETENTAEGSRTEQTSEPVPETAQVTAKPLETMVTEVKTEKSGTEATVKAVPPTSNGKERTYLYTDDNGVEYAYHNGYNDGICYSLKLNGTWYMALIYPDSCDKMDAHFYFDGEKLYAVCTDKVTGNPQQELNGTFFYTAGIPEDGDSIELFSCERYSAENVAAMADLYERLREISPRWINPMKKQAEFIACGSFINENCHALNEDELAIYETPYHDEKFKDSDFVEKYDAVWGKNSSASRSYRLFLTPENIGELSELEGAAISDLYCYLSEVGLDLSSLDKAAILRYTPEGLGAYVGSYIAVYGTPKPSDFLKKVSLAVNYNGKMSLFGNIIEFENSRVTIDIPVLSDYVNMNNCDIVLENQLAGEVTSITFRNCRFDKTPDFSRIKLVPNHDIYGSLIFDCPGQKAVGLDRVGNRTSAQMEVNGDVDFKDFKFLNCENRIYYTVRISTTGTLNIDDLLENDYSSDFYAIGFEECITKEQFDRLVEKYPENSISAKINDVVYYHHGEYYYGL